jgi:hypothetical protein
MHWRLIIVVVQFGTVKIYVGAVGRGSAKTKDRMKLSLPPIIDGFLTVCMTKLRVLVLCFFLLYG